MRCIKGQKILLLFFSIVFIFTAFPITSLAAPKGSATTNCWGSGGQIEISLSGCSGYKKITVIAEFSGKIDSATGWGFDSYAIDGNRVTATCSSTGPNSWGFDSKVGIQVAGSDVNSAKLISVSGDGESGSVSDKKEPESAPSDTKSTQPVTPVKSPDPAKTIKGEKGDDWLTTEGSHIVDKDGKEVWLTGCNWFGYNTGTNLFDGVWNCNLKESLKAIADRGFNVLRVPMSAELLLQWKKGEYPRANYNNAYNEELNSMNSLEIFDYVLSLCEQNGLKIIIDIHTVKTDASGHNYPVWYRDDMKEDDFIEIQGTPINKKEDKVYYLLNKPRGVVTTSKDDKNRKTVVDLIKTNAGEDRYKEGSFYRASINYDTSVTNDYEIEDIVTGLKVDLENRYEFSNLQLKENEERNTELKNQIVEQKNKIQILNEELNQLMKTLELEKSKVKEKDLENKKLGLRIQEIKATYEKKKEGGAEEQKEPLEEEEEDS